VGRAGAGQRAGYGGSSAAGRAAGRWLTRRGRVAAWLLAAALAVAAYGIGAAAGGGGAESVSYVPTREVVVHQGDSLWSIAEGLTPPGGDVRQVVALLQELNGLRSPSIRGGDVLLVPAT
jgi:hypothetical protein